MGYSPWGCKELDTTEWLSPHWWRSWKLCLWQETLTRAMRFPSQRLPYLSNVGLIPQIWAIARDHREQSWEEPCALLHEPSCSYETLLPNFFGGIVSLKEIITERRNSGSALLEMGAAQRLDTPPWLLTSKPHPSTSGSPSHHNHHHDAKPYNLETQTLSTSWKALCELNKPLKT